MLGQLGDERQEHQLAGRRARREKADDQAAPLREPAGGDGRREDDGGETGAEPDDHAPQQYELPHPRHPERCQEARGDQAERTHDDAADAEFIHERGGERAEQAEQQDAQRQRRGDLRIVPAELAFERYDHDAGRAHRARRHQHGEEGDGDDHPAVMDVAAGECSGECRRRHSRGDFLGPGLNDGRRQSGIVGEELHALRSRPEHPLAT